VGNDEYGLEDRLLAALMRRRMRRLQRRRASRAGEPRFAASLPEVYDVQEELIARYAEGRSFADLACLWKVHGGCAFLAEEHGATSVTASDLWAASDEFEAERERRGSSVRFVQADIHDTALAERVGPHDVVWCSGFMYHTALPHLAMANLLSMASEYLIIGSKVIPSTPGLPGAAVFYPGLTDEERSLYAPVTRTVAEQPFQREMRGAGWWWGFSPEALVGIARSIAEVELVEELHLPWLRRHDSYYAVLRVPNAA
jgi:hypothetical protein